MRTLDFSQRETLRVVMPGGETLELLPSRPTLAWTRKYQALSQDLQKKMEAGEIDSGEFIFQLILEMVENRKEFPKNVFTVPELTEIMTELRDITSHPRRTDEEKKTQ